LKARTFWPFFALFSASSLSVQAADELPDGRARESAPSSAGESSGSASNRGPDSPTDESDDEAFGHGRQFGLRVGLVGGYNMIFRYDQSPLCNAYDAAKSASDQQKFCGHAAPLAIDIAASFAPLDFVEPYVFMRLGLAGEKQTGTSPVKILGAGARIYTMSDSAFKIFIEPALAYEFEGGSGNAGYPGYNPQYKNDLLIHLAAGPQLDIARHLGLFVDAGLTTGIFRAIHTELELEAGVQARFP
jgi:hypothetical protein